MSQLDCYDRWFCRSFDRSSPGNDGNIYRGDSCAPIIGGLCERKYRNQIFVPYYLTDNHSILWQPFACAHFFAHGDGRMEDPSAGGLACHLGNINSLYNRLFDYYKGDHACPSQGYSTSKFYANASGCGCGMDFLYRVPRYLDLGWGSRYLSCDNLCCTKGCSPRSKAKIASGPRIIELCVWLKPNPESFLTRRFRRYSFGKRQYRWHYI